MDIPEERIQTRKQGKRILHTKKSALYDLRGKPAYLLGISEDITEKKEAQHKLAESEKRLQLALTASGIGTWFWNIKTNNVTADENAYRLFGINLKTFKPSYENVMSLIHPKDRARATQLSQDSALTGKDYSNEYTIQRPDGSLRDVAVRAVVSRDAQDKPLSMTGICWDITEQQQKHALEVKSEMISMVSHELRTPLHTIKESISVVLEGLTGPVNEEQLDVLQTAQQCIDRLTRLINNVLDFQKMEAGISDLDFERKDLNEIVRGIAEIERPAAQKKGLLLDLEICDSALVAKIDADKIIQVLTNLIHNAIKFTEKGSVVISTEKLGHEVKISILDTGIGFSEDEAEKIFSKFGQTETARRLFPQGTGLGLAISKKIITQHCGKIWAESKKPLGSVFSIVLPLDQ